jgi:hypothetical protein
MARCDVCGNEYDRTMQITRGGTTGTFDSFECAIHALAPRCGHCGCAIVGHGVEANGETFCCAHCARHAGVEGAVDRVAGRADPLYEDVPGQSGQPEGFGA